MDYEQQKAQYAQQLLAVNIKDSSQVEKITSESFWWIVDSEHRKAFQAKVYQFLEDNVDTLPAMDIKRFLPVLSYFKFESRVIDALLRRSAEEGQIFLHVNNFPLEYYFDSLPNEIVHKYILLLNKEDSSQIEFLPYRLSKTAGAFDSFKQMYLELFFSEKADSAKPVASKQMNTHAACYALEAFLTNRATPIEQKVDILQQSNQGTTLISYVLRLLKSGGLEEREANLLMPIAIEKGLQSEDIIKNLFFNQLFSNDEKVVKLLKATIESCQTKDLMDKMTKQYEKLHDNCSYRLNVVQEAILMKKEKEAFTALCKDSEEFFNILQKPIREKINGYGFYLSPLEYAIKNGGDNDKIEDIYSHRLYQDKLCANDKDRLCCLIFNQMRYTSVTNSKFLPRMEVLALLPLKTVSKYTREFTEYLSPEVFARVTQVKEVLSLQAKLPSSAPLGNTEKKARSKI